MVLTRAGGAPLNASNYNEVVDLLSGAAGLTFLSSAGGLLQLGGGGFAGGGSPNFLGSSAGTVLALNAPSGYAGALLDLQVGGARALLVTGSQVTIPVSTSIQSTLGVTGAAQFNSTVTSLGAVRISPGGNVTGLDWGPPQSEILFTTGTAGSYSVANAGLALANPNAVAANGEPGTMWDVRLSGLLDIYADGCGGTTATYGASATDAVGTAVNFSSAVNQFFGLRIGRDPGTETPTGSGKFYVGVSNLTELNADLSRPSNAGTVNRYGWWAVSNSRNWGITSGFGPTGDNNPTVLAVSQRGEQVSRIVNSLQFATAGLAWVHKWKAGQAHDSPVPFYTLYNTGMIQLGQPGVVIAPPAASATYDGCVMVVYGGGGTADTLQICLKAAGGTYSWKTIVTG